LTVSELARELGDGGTDSPSVAITFDDGAASVAHVAAPLLAARGLTATVFCVAGHLGGVNDWLTAPAGAPVFDLVSEHDLRTLADAGFEIGGHGLTHAPLGTMPAEELEAEVVGSADALERVAAQPVCAFAYPYGILPTANARRAIEERYECACATTPGYVDAGADAYDLPRVDAHYLRSSRLLAAALEGRAAAYLRARRFGASARRALRRDYVAVGGAT
jgi:peptidoglycan/xylan/chitin deacetylase (PgdA/CDA1 family)